MAPPHPGVTLMAVLAAAALLLTLDAPVSSARVGRYWGVVEERTFMRRPYSVKALSFGISESERLNTLKVLQAFAAALPSLGWRGDDFCSWSGVACFDTNVSILVSNAWVSGTLPEMPDDVDYSMVKLDEIHLFGQYSGITGTLPHSWAKLQHVRTIRFGYTGISGTLPAAWCMMAAIENFVVFRSRITGTLPDAWSTMRNLRRIYIVDCNLYGSLPESWARIPLLESVSLHKNHFCGCVPQSWLTSPILLMGVDAKHRRANCTKTEPCVNTAVPHPAMSRSSTSTTAESTTPSLPPEHQCSVPNCISCLPRDPNLCVLCSDGYVLTDDGQCVKSPEWEAVPLAMTESESRNTLKVLQAFAAAMPSLGWSGDNFCSWTGVRCVDASVSAVVSRSWVTGTLPEMPDDVDYSMVKLEQIIIVGQHSGITGTLPESWGKLRNVRTVSLAYINISGTLPAAWASMRSLRFLRLRSVNVSGTLPAAWSSMEVIEQVMIFNTEITGTLPEAWSTMPKLARIYLERCNLYGSLPESWARMPSLGHLNLYNNRFCGCVPQSWLTSSTLLVSVDTKHLLRNCTNDKGCLEVTATRPPAQYDPRCNVHNCIWCLRGESKLCGVCFYGYVLTDDWQCMKSPEWEAVPFTMSEAERGSTLKVLQAFAAAMPSLGWSGGDFCNWSGVTCLGDNVSVILARSWVTGTLPEMPDDVDYSMVKLNGISIFGQHRGITGTLPSSWGKLRKVRTVRLGYTGISGTLPAAWSSMETIEQIILSNTQITGTLPEAWSGLRNLRRIYLNRCNLYGSLPQSWARMPSLERVRLENNDFCGCIPSLWLRGLTARVDVDAKQRMPDCATTEACIAMSTRDLAASSWSTSGAGEPTAPPPPSDPYCNVPRCLWCLSSDPMRCGVCSDGCLLTAGWQCLERTF